MRENKGTAVNAPRPIMPAPCEHSWIATAFEVKELFPNGQVKRVEATATMCTRCGERKEL